MTARLAKGPLTSARGRQSVSLLLYGTGTLSSLTAKRNEETLLPGWAVVSL